MRHKHADTIIAWANGAVIQFLLLDTNGWVDCRNNKPHWHDDFEYRVKPKEKEKVYQYAYMATLSSVVEVSRAHYRTDLSFLNTFQIPPRWFVRLDPSMKEIDKE